MKKINLFFALFFSGTMFCQNGSGEDPKYVMPNELNYYIYTSDFADSKNKLETYLKNNKMVILNQNEVDNSRYYEFYAQKSDLEVIDFVCKTLGYISSKKMSSQNDDNRLPELRLELERREVKKREYEIMLNRIDSVKSSLYYSHWEKIRSIDYEIYQTKKLIQQLEQIGGKYRVSITIKDEQSTPSNSDVNFVHMPGAEYVYFFTENPKEGISYAQYQGLYLKYLFTAGKSYFSLGALKAIDKKAGDSTSFDEMFTFTFGQDWYSRYLGRGKNKFMNLYIGYQAGVSLAYNQRDITWLPYVSPSTGIELFKNKYLLFDVNMNYYLPISDMNQHVRGFRFGGSINFSF